MIDIKLDKTHDIAIEKGDFVIIDGAERVAQQILIKLKLWTGEWFLDDSFGTPYLQDVLGKQLTLSAVIASIKKSILEVDGVKSIDDFKYVYNRSERKLDIEFKANTDYGIVEVQL